MSYNSANVIPATLQNIAQQKSEFIEYIIIDGASTDYSNKLFEEYQAIIDKTVIEKDKGIYDAMNKGLNLANGEYVLFMNAGDYFHTTSTLSKIVTCLQKNHPDVLYGETMLINQNGKHIGLRSEQSSRKLPNNLNWKSLQQGMVVSHQSFIVRKSIAPSYDLQYSSSADVDWVIKCLKKSKKIQQTDFIIANYLVGGYSKQTLNTSLSERFKIFNKHYGFLRNLANHLIITLRAIRYKLLGKELN